MPAVPRCGVANCQLWLEEEVRDKVFIIVTIRNVQQQGIIAHSSKLSRVMEISINQERTDYLIPTISLSASMVSSTLKMILEVEKIRSISNLDFIPLFS